MKEREPLLYKGKGTFSDSLRKTFRMDGSEVKYRTYFVSCACFFTDLDTGFHKELLNVCHNVAKKNPQIYQSVSQNANPESRKRGFLCLLDVQFCSLQINFANCISLKVSLYFPLH